jgi:hypothetical protein
MATRVLNALWPADFRAVAPSISSPDGTKSIDPMLNRSYGVSTNRRLVTFDVRDAEGQFMHHVQTDFESDEAWSIGWHTSNTVVVKGSRSGIHAYLVGVDSMVYQLPEPLPEDVVSSARKLT